eukprot:9478213-Pyramimonas_sp.AAC.1
MYGPHHRRLRGEAATETIDHSLARGGALLGALLGQSIETPPPQRQWGRTWRTSSTRPDHSA